MCYICNTLIYILLLNNHSIFHCSVYLQVKEDVKPQLENQHSDSDFEATLQELDKRKYVCTKEKEKTPVKEKQKHALHASGFSKSAVTFYEMPINVTREAQSKSGKEVINEMKEDKEKETTKLIPQSRTSSDLPIKNNKYKSVSQSVRNESNYQEEVKSSPPNVKKFGTSSSDDVFERKKQHAVQYQRYLQRQGPKNPGGKEIPQVVHLVRTLICGRCRHHINCNAGTSASVQRLVSAKSYHD
jgi:hypothetical protein